jgi:hypothetical protein
LTEAIKAMMRRRDRRLLGTMLQTLLAYPDYPYGWGPIGYRDFGDDGSKYVTITTPPNLAEDVIRPKERELIELVRSENAKKRKVWVYVQFTDRHDVQGRLEGILREAGLNVEVLRPSVALARREEWIAEHAPRLDVGYNFPTVCFYETGYNLFTLRQASRRSWRIGQTEPCRIVYLHYQDTMQGRAMALMGKKLTAAQALEGVFSSEGLVAMAGEDANVEIALARSLVERMDEGDARRLWNKVINTGRVKEQAPSVGEDHLLWQDDVVQLPNVLSFRRPLRRRVLSLTPRLTRRRLAGTLF